MKDAIVKTLIVVQPFLSRVYESCTTRPGSKDGNGAAAEDKSQCFEVLGFDIILDNKLKPWVLEVNHSPSLTCDADVDRDVKLALLSDSLRLLGLDQADEDSSTSAVAYRKRVLLAGRRDSHKRLVRMNNATAKVSRTVATSASPSSSSLALKAWEDHRIGSFERIFPIYDDPTLSDTYEKLLSASKATMALDQKETNAMRARKAFIQEKEAVKQKAENKFAAWKKAVSAGKYKVPTVSACTPEVRLEAPNEASHSVESQAACSSEETKRLPKIHGATSITKSTLVPKLMDWDYVDAFTPPTTKNKTVTNASRRRSSPPTTSTTDLRLSSSNAYSYRDITYDIDQMRI